MIDQHRLDSYLLSIPGGVDLMEEDTSSSISQVNRMEAAKRKGNGDEVVALLLHNITDPFLAERSLPFSYRTSLVPLFGSPWAERIHVCNEIFAVLHQNSDKVLGLAPLDLSHGDLDVFLFKSLNQIMNAAFPDEIGKKKMKQSKYYTHLQRWVRAQCYKNESSLCWEHFFEFGKPLRSFC